MPPYGFLSADSKSALHGVCVTSMSVTALFAITELYNQPRFPTSKECIKKKGIVYTMEVFSALK